MRPFEAFVYSAFSAISRFEHTKSMHFDTEIKARQAAATVGPLTKLISVRGNTVTVLKPCTINEMLWKDVLEISDTHSLQNWADEAGLSSSIWGMPAETELTFSQWMLMVHTRFGNDLPPKKREMCAMMDLDEKTETPYEYLLGEARRILVGYDDKDVQNLCKQTDMYVKTIQELSRMHSGDSIKLMACINDLTKVHDKYKQKTIDLTSRQEREQLLTARNMDISKHNSVLLREYNEALALYYRIVNQVQRHFNEHTQ